MRREPLTQYIGANLTIGERLALERMAEERGATLSGTLRKLIRDAARRVDLELAKGRDSHAATVNHEG